MNAQRNGTAKTRSADAWTSQKMEIWTKFGNSDLSERYGDGDTGRAQSREQAANGPHQRGEDEAPGEQVGGDAEFERQFAEALHVHRAGRQTVDRQREYAANHAADDRQRHRL